MDSIQASLTYLEKNYARFIQELIEHSKIPSVSASGFPLEPMEQSAQWVAQRMKQSGLENIEILKIPNTHPYIYGDWLHAPNAPTVLLYAHHDVQPPGRAEKWHNPPFQPEQRNGRLYGRGVVDDKAGGMMHFAALESILKSCGQLPINIKFIVEGEEEIGSDHLPYFLKTYREKLNCDIMVLTDTANLQIGLPSITYSLRGIIDAVVEVSTLDHPVHSGMWGGPGLDALTVLSKILARLHAPDGKLAIPNFYDDILPVSEEELAQLRALPFDKKTFSQELGLAPGMQLAGEQNYSVYERIWTRPTASVLAINAPSIEKTTNQLVEKASAKVSARIVPGMDPKKSLKQLCNFLAQDPPYGAKIKVIPGAAGEPWHIKPQGKAFTVAEAALTKGFGKKPVYIGCGGSIPFVKPLTQAFNNIPALLIGLEDPTCNAHGENESLHLEDWLKGMKSAIYLYFGFK